MSSTAGGHVPVMPDEVIAYLAPRSAGLYLDGTLGGAGHARLLLEASSPDGRLVGLDRDPAAITRAQDVLAPFADRIDLRHCNFAQMEQVARELGIDGFDGILLDLGVSSYQLDEAERGFSFRADAPLDMRMDDSTGLTAAEVLAGEDEKELARIFREFGEERYARRIARRIVAQREQEPLVSTGQLAELVRDAVPGGHVPARIHPATRVFQALRIYVNDELRFVEQGLEQAVSLLRPGGRLVVISFHSLEDRRVKHFFRELATGCTCPPRIPMCVCGKQPSVRLLTRRGVRAGESEIAFNSRSRSAILRAVEKLPPQEL
ncbi:16S rRNA (cytosine(1402)-N(4))-methyltransferase RsmH [Geoalkalibacter subterraneus]|uniref:Ribosomal RNA small subunit methyltransferase H n=1 Tax=Geoalkalibacter subterraneus TaxID=483547 RepID=A0A0B5FUK6_9BACT|nr:16S rRNA (cytosine(1402)-N(4))-methyltransferase RsmH [Geoalkalibacter subterraneus]AJF07296.1 16S rRNA methyltransferase [Geoalkalibacter subterraneus]